MQATDGGLDVLAATCEGGQVEEPHQLFDIGLDVAVHRGHGFVGIVHGWVRLGRPSIRIAMRLRVQAQVRACRLRETAHFPRSGGWGIVTSLFKLRR